MCAGSHPSSQHLPSMTARYRSRHPTTLRKPRLAPGSQRESLTHRTGAKDTPEHIENAVSSPLPRRLFAFFCPATQVLGQGEPLLAASIHAGFKTEHEFQTGFDGFFGEKSACKKVTFDVFHVRIHPQRPSGCSWASCPTFKVAARGVQTSFRSCVQRDGRSKPKKARLGLGAGEVPWPKSVPTD